LNFKQFNCVMSGYNLSDTVMSYSVMSDTVMSDFNMIDTMMSGYNLYVEGQVRHFDVRL